MRRDGIFKRPDRGGWRISYKDGLGRRRREKINAATRTEAKTILAAKRVQAERDRELGFTAPSEKTFAEVAQEFMVYQKDRIGAEEYEREHGIIEKHLKPFFAGALREISKATVARFVTKRSGEASPGSVVKELNVLKHLLRIASEVWEYIPLNVARGVKPPKVSRGRVRYLQPGELRAVLEACPDWLRVIVAIAVTTGMRRGEILKLRWLDVDLIHSRALLPQTKNGEGRVVYLNKMAIAAITSLPFTRSAAPLFPGIDGRDVSRHFTDVCRRLGIADFHFHDLRHTAASWLRMAGSDIHTVASLLGHKDLRMAARYQHLSPDFLAEAVGRLDQVFGRQEVTGPKVLTAGVAANA
jgi:integrase